MRRHDSAIVFGDRPVDVELPCRQGGTQKRRRTEAKIDNTGGLQRGLLAAIAGLNLLEPRGRRIGLDLGRYFPGYLAALVAALVAAFVAALGLWRCRCGQHERAFEARRTGLKAEHALEIDRQRPLARIDVEVKARTTAIRGLSGRDAERIARSGNREAAVAAHRPGE